MTSEALDGLLLVDKPAGPTSHDVVATARRRLAMRRIGHTGTLDPFATGLLLLLLGRSTRLAQYFDGLAKAYVARVTLGLATTTDDPTGEATDSSTAWRDLDPEQIAHTLQTQVGERLQRPPAFSAKKREGRRAYAAARAGQPLALAPVPVRIDEIRVIATALPHIDFEIVCGAGTYVRAVARDLGEDLNCPAHLAALRRTRIGPHRVESAVPLGDLDVATAGRALVPPLEALRHLPRVDVSADDAVRLRTGRPIEVADAPAQGTPVAIAADERLLAIGEVRAGLLRPRKVFADA